MKIAVAIVLLCSVALPVVAQQGNARPQRRPPMRPLLVEHQIDGLLGHATQSFAARKPIYERDLAVLDHLQKADQALVDAMQPAIALQKAWERVAEAKRLDPEFLVKQGVVLMTDELERARRSSTSANLSRLRVLLEQEATGPARRVVARNALEIQEETHAWLEAQERIAMHLRQLSDVATASLRQTQLEE